MRIKVLIKLSTGFGTRIDRIAGNRLKFLTITAAAGRAKLERAARDHRDREILDRNAGQFNRESEDVLRYESPL